MDERHRLEYGLELLIQWITNRLDEILSILTRDNMLGKKGKKRVYPLPSVNPRAVTISSTGDARKMQEDIQKDMIEINNYAFQTPPRGRRRQTHHLLRWIRHPRRQHSETTQHKNKPRSHKQQNQYSKESRQSPTHRQLQ